MLSTAHLNERGLAGWILRDGNTALLKAIVGYLLPGDVSGAMHRRVYEAAVAAVEQPGESCAETVLRALTTEGSAPLALTDLVELRTGTPPLDPRDCARAVLRESIRTRLGGVGLRVEALAPEDTVAISSVIKLLEASFLQLDRSPLSSAGDGTAGAVRATGVAWRRVLEAYDAEAPTPARRTAPQLDVEQRRRAETEGLRLLMQRPDVTRRLLPGRDLARWTPEDVLDARILSALRVRSVMRPAPSVEPVNPIAVYNAVLNQVQRRGHEIEPEYVLGRVSELYDRPVGDPKAAETGLKQVAFEDARAAAVSSLRQGAVGEVSIATATLEALTSVQRAAAIAPSLAAARRQQPGAGAPSR